MSNKDISDNTQEFDNNVPCEPYIFNIFHLFLPSIAIFTNLCVSYSKTQLFIVACCRIFISWLISYYVEPLLLETHYDFLIHIIYAWIIINILALAIILIKIPIFDSTDNDVTPDSLIIHQYDYNGSITSDEVI